MWASTQMFTVQAKHDVDSAKAKKSGGNASMWAAIAQMVVQKAGSVVNTALGAAANESNYNAQMRSLDFNAALADREANNTLAAGDENNARSRENLRYIFGSQAADFGKAGAAASSGSPLAVMAQASANAELQIADAQREYRIKAQSYQQQADIYRWQSDGIKRQKSLARDMAMVNQFLS